MLVLITDHSLLKQIDPLELAPLMRNKNLIDTRNCLAHKMWKEAVFSASELVPTGGGLIGDHPVVGK